MSLLGCVSAYDFSSFNWGEEGLTPSADNDMALVEHACRKTGWHGGVMNYDCIHECSIVYAIPTHFHDDIKLLSRTAQIFKGFI